MTRKRQRLYFVLVGMLALGGAAALVLNAFEESLVFFYSPTDALAKDIPADRRFRVGGLVEEGSVARQANGLTVGFRVTDLKTSILVAYTGMLPDMFREGQGVVAEGYLGADGTFRAEDVLAKHDETYMPPEVAEALRESGLWRGGEASGGEAREATP
jgi:cytochrome c-type biogenesis protein CcmE